MWLLKISLGYTLKFCKLPAISNFGKSKISTITVREASLLSHSCKTVVKQIDYMFLYVLITYDVKMGRFSVKTLFILLSYTFLSYFFPKNSLLVILRSPIQSVVLSRTNQVVVYKLSRLMSAVQWSTFSKP